MKRTVLAPKSVKVGPFRYKVRFGVHEHDEGHLLLGRLHHISETMLVSTIQSKRNQQETMVHESLHGILELTGLSYEMRDQPEMEEELVRRLAPTILGWLRENKGMTTWLCS
jgi:hypothetical protein